MRYVTLALLDTDDLQAEHGTAAAGLADEIRAALAATVWDEGRIVTVTTIDLDERCECNHTRGNHWSPLYDATTAWCMTSDMTCGSCEADADELENPDEEHCPVTGRPHEWIMGETCYCESFTVPQPAAATTTATSI
jgi:hypothetical protein